MIKLWKKRFMFARRKTQEILSGANHCNNQEESIATLIKKEALKETS